jgi:hypothetical protein
MSSVEVTAADVIAARELLADLQSPTEESVQKLAESIARLRAVSTGVPHAALGLALNAVMNAKVEAYRAGHNAAATLVIKWLEGILAAARNVTPESPRDEVEKAVMVQLLESMAENLKLVLFNRVKKEDLS